MPNPKTFPLNLQFKGQRDYIQGGDIYNAINRLAPQLTDARDAFVSSLAFRRFAKNDCDLLLDKPSMDQNYVAKGKISDGQKKDLPNFWVLETERIPAGRYAFDENAIITPASIKDKEIVLQGQTDYSPIEEIIALTKALHYHHMPNISGKWVFGQLDLLQPLSNKRQTVRIELQSVKAGKFSMSRIFADDEFTGDIRFIVGEP
jgi:hypothetical protein